MTEMESIKAGDIVEAYGETAIADTGVELVKTGKNRSRMMIQATFESGKSYYVPLQHVDRIIG